MIKTLKFPIEKEVYGIINVKFIKEGEPEVGDEVEEGQLVDKNFPIRYSYKVKFFSPNLLSSGPITYHFPKGYKEYIEEHKKKDVARLVKEHNKSPHFYDYAVDQYYRVDNEPPIWQPSSSFLASHLKDKGKSIEFSTYFIIPLNVKIERKTRNK